MYCSSLELPYYDILGRDPTLSNIMNLECNTGFKHLVSVLLVLLYNFESIKCMYAILVHFDLFGAASLSAP